MGLLEARSNRIDKALSYYAQSIREAGPNTAQVPYTYMEMGRLYFEKKENYAKAQVYYDSALALLPKQAPEYAGLATRKKTLDDFVQYSTTIRTEDSLLTLVKIDRPALEKKLDKILAERDKADQERAALAQQIIDRATGGNTSSIPGATNSDLAPGQRWVLYNPVALSQGRQEFTSRWGNRPLADDWRRSTKESSEAIAGVNSPVNNDVQANAINPNPTLPIADAGATRVGQPTQSSNARRDGLQAQLPFSREAQAQASQRIENALYKLGKLYKFDLDRPAQAIPTFEQLLTRFPNTLQKPEVYYLLFLSNEQLGQASVLERKATH